MTAFYKLSIKKSAEKELRKITNPYLEKVVHKLTSLSSNPRPHGAEKLKGEASLMRVRQGDFRIVYEVDDAARHITVIKIGHRREVYN